MPDVQVLPFDNTADSLAALKQGRAVAYAQDVTLLVGIVAKDPSLTIVADSEVRGPLNIGMKFGDTALNAWANAAIAELTKEDFFWKTLQKWVPADAIEGFKDAVPRPGGRKRGKTPGEDYRNSVVDALCDLAAMTTGLLPIRRGTRRHAASLRPDFCPSYGWTADLQRRGERHLQMPLS